MMFRRAFAVLLVCFGLVGPSVQAQDLALPTGARPLADRPTAVGGYQLPLAGYDGQQVRGAEFKGRIDRRTWRIDGTAATALQVLQPLIDQLVTGGYEMVFECRDRDCGGFDFRYGIEVVPAPDMHVDMRDFRFASMLRGDEEAVGLLVSRSRSAIYLQIISVTPVDSAAPFVAPSDTVAPLPVAKPQTEPPPTATPSGDVAQRLLADGHVILADLEFASGAATLAQESYASLAALAELMKTQTALKLVLVGHTDATGGLAQNIALSKRRAGAVRDMLINNYGADGARITAEGAGYLAPVASNLNPDGQDANRRVEAVIVSN